MDKVKPKLERGAGADLWRNTLSRIPSIFGRLVYLSSLRDPNTGRYEHHGLAQIFGQQEANLTLRRSHIDTFSTWLCFSLEEQKRDLEDYLAEAGDKRTILANWSRLAPYRNFVPAEAREVERHLYSTDLETVLELFRNEYGVSAPDPNA
jgi:hypothetical protein